MGFSTDLEDLLYHLFPGKSPLRNMTHIAGKKDWFMASSSPPSTVVSIVEKGRTTNHFSQLVRTEQMWLKSQLSLQRYLGLKSRNP